MISILTRLLRGFNIKIKRVNKTIKSEFVEIRHDLDEHLQAINENTNEIAANFEYIAEIERKLDRLNERLDEIQMYIGMNEVMSKKRAFEVKRLNRREQEIFLVVYTLEEEKGTLSYKDIAAKMHISEELACSYVTALIEKGVPIIKRYIHSKPYFKLDPDFKTLQTKENILQLGLEEFGF